MQHVRAMGACATGVQTLIRIYIYKTPDIRNCFRDNWLIKKKSSTAGLL